MLVELVLCLVTVSLLLYRYLTRNHDYWKKKGVISVESKFPLGLVHDQFFNIRDAGSTSQMHYSLYKQHGLKYAGGYLIHIPTLIVFDLDLCKTILTKDFNNFVNRDFTPSTHEFISKHLFALEGQDWRRIRLKLTPTFTSGKMKNMFPLLEKCSQQLQKYIDEVIIDKGVFLVKELLLRFTTDVIASCAFGLETNSVDSPDNDFYELTKLVFEPKRSMYVNFLVQKNFPKLAKFLNITFYHKKIAYDLKRIMKEHLEYRKNCTTKRNDFIDLLLEIKDNKVTHNGTKDSRERNGQINNQVNNGKAANIELDQGPLTLEEMTAQAFVFFAAGFETAASASSFCLYELAMNKDVQDRLRHEVDLVLAKYDGQISYQAMQEMTYMDQVVNETLRRYASFPVLTRVCTERYQVPNTDLVIDKGVRIHVPTFAIHHDPDIYPDPFRFDPDRFSEENSRQRHGYAFLPFGEGPRQCIGMRFGRMQVKMALITFISNYELSPATNTPSKVKLSATMIVTTPDEHFSLKITKRTGS